MARRHTQMPGKWKLVSLIILMAAVLEPLHASEFMHGTLIVIDKDIPGAPNVDDDYALRQEDGSLHRLLFGDTTPPDRYGSGNHITVQLRDAPPRAARLMEVDATQPAPSPPPLQVKAFAIQPPQEAQDAQVAALPLQQGPLLRASSGVQADEISMAVFLVDMCGKGGGPAATREAVSAMLFDSGGMDLSSYFSTCSHGVAKLRPETTLIIGPITMPCSGTNKNTSWTVSSCDMDDYYGWMFYAEEWAARQSPPLDLSPYRHRVLVTPRGQEGFMAPGTNQCGWSGQAVIGPYSGGSWSAPNAYSYAWISGDYWASTQGWFHEIGHNYFLGHSGVPDATIYSDYSCAMGYCCKPRCMNPPHNWQLGWGTEVDEGRSSMEPGETRTYSLPAQNLDREHVLRIPVPWASDGTTFWLGYRVDSFPIDLVSLASGTNTFSNGVNVYMYPGTSVADATNTMQIGFVARGRQWLDTQYDSGLVVQHLASDGQHASITVCRIGGSHEMCGAGIDYDCDGLVDELDPDCVAASPPPGPAKSPSPVSKPPRIAPPPLVPKPPPVLPPDSPPPPDPMTVECSSKANFDYISWIFTSEAARVKCCGWCRTEGMYKAVVCRSVYDKLGNLFSACSRSYTPAVPPYVADPSPSPTPSPRLTPSPRPSPSTSPSQTSHTSRPPPQ